METSIERGINPRFFILGESQSFPSYIDSPVVNIEKPTLDHDRYKKCWFYVNRNNVLHVQTFLEGQTIGTTLFTVDVTDVYRP